MGKIIKSWFVLLVVFFVALNCYGLNDITGFRTTVDVREFMDGVDGRPTYLQWCLNPFTTDVILSIEAARDSISTGKVLLPIGHLRISHPIVGKDSVDLFGLNENGTSIEPSDQTFEAVNVGNIGQFKYGHFKIDYGVATGNAPATNPAAIGIKFDSQNVNYANRFSMSNIYIMYAYRGIQDISPAWAYSLENFHIYYTGNYPVFIGTVGGSGKGSVALKNFSVSSQYGGYCISNVVGLSMDNTSSTGVIKGNGLPFYITGCRGTLINPYSEGNTIGAGGAIYSIAGSSLTLISPISAGDVFDAEGGESYIFQTNSSAQVNILSPQVSPPNALSNGLYAIVYGGNNNFPTIVSAPNFSLITGLGTKLVYYAYVESNSWEIKTFGDGDTQPSVSGYNTFKTANSSATKIITFYFGYVGQKIKVLIQDSNTTIDFTETNLKRSGGSDWSPLNGDWMDCVFDGVNWYCTTS